VSSSVLALAHGTNDAQKTMGVITLTLITVGVLPAGAGPPLWVIASCGLAIGLGTALGGWRIIRTMGRRISYVHSPQGFAAETSSAAVILCSAHLGFALSTTQVCSGSIFGAGTGCSLVNVRWSVGARMALTWLLTLPAAGVTGALAQTMAGRGSYGTVAVALVALLVAAGVYVRSRRQPVTAGNVNDVPAGESLVPSA
jgi:PiT family inorganic phosphate transporter